MNPLARQAASVANDPKRSFETFGLAAGRINCRSIIQAHGGRLWATANEPRGAVFPGPGIDPEQCERVFDPV
jgi:hypothetical protein